MATKEEFLGYCRKYRVDCADLWAEFDFSQGDPHPSPQSTFLICLQVVELGLALVGLVFWGVRRFRRQVARQIPVLLDPEGVALGEVEPEPRAGAVHRGAADGGEHLPEVLPP